LNILIRVDASLNIGSGHVIRCLTLAKKIKEKDKNVNIIFVCRAHQGHMHENIEASGFICLLLDNDKESEKNIETDELGKNEYLSWLGCSLAQDVKQTIEIAKKYSLQHFSNATYDWLLCDHYAIEKTWQKRMREIVNNIFVIDDLANREHDCNVLLDQTFNCKKNKYVNKIKEGTLQLLGTNYALLGNDYSKLRTRKLLQNRNNALQPRKILIFMGGSDKQNWTLKVLRVLNCFIKESTVFLDIDVNIVIGAQYQYERELYSVISECPFKVNLLKNISSMAKTIAGSDLAIGAGGGSSWERCCLALPTLTCVVADNQSELSEKLENFGAIIKWRTVSELLTELKGLFSSKNRLSKISLAASKVCDGEGASRVSDMILNMNELSIRNATIDDSELYLQWRNDPVVRANAFNTNKITLEIHNNWYTKKINDYFSQFYLLHKNKEPVGQVRFELNEIETEAEINYSIAHDFRGKGLALALMKKSVDTVFQEKKSLNKLIAKVKRENVASNRVFDKLEFKKINHSDNTMNIFEFIKISK